MPQCFPLPTDALVFTKASASVVFLCLQAVFRTVSEHGIPTYFSAMQEALKIISAVV